MDRRGDDTVHFGVAGRGGQRNEVRHSRAVEWAGTFAFPRAAGTKGEREAAAIAAEELARLGLRVERVGCPRVSVAKAGRALARLARSGGLGDRPGVGGPPRRPLAGPAGAGIGALLWLRLTAVEGFLLGRALLRHVATTNVIAWREGKGEPPPLRVVFHTTLDTFEARRELVPPWLATRVIGALLAALIFCDMTINRNPLGLPSWCWPWSGPLFLLLLWLAIAMRIARLVGGTGRPDARDNRTGLAVLLELARGWPRATDSRIESRFVATGGRTLDRAGLRALIQAIGTEWPARPTLVVDWLAPGSARDSLFWSRGPKCSRRRPPATSGSPTAWSTAPRLAASTGHWAATDRPTSAWSATPSPRTGPQSLTANRARRSRPRAQLATEVALRWARRKQKPEERPLTQ